MAEILLLPVSENKRSPYWNSTSGFDFDIFTEYECTDSALAYQISPELDHLPQSYDIIVIFKMAAISHVGFALE